MSSAIDEQEQQRNLLFMANPRLWTVWPYLPLVRRPGKGGEDYECGLLCDLQGWRRLSGFRCTVFLTNLFLLPESPDQILDLAKETFDTFEELLAAGWRVD
jgi:hypothetical protein